MANEKIYELIDELGQELLKNYFDFNSKVRTVVAMANDQSEFEEFMKVINDAEKLINDVLAFGNEA